MPSAAVKIPVQTTERPKERKCVLPMQRLKLAEEGEDGRRRFEGYAAVFGNRDAHGDIIVPGAFSKSLQENTDVKVLWQHDSDQPIGKMELGVENDHGLLVRAVMSNIPLVTDTVVPLLNDGVVNGLSIGYSVQQEEYVADLNAWLLKEIDLFEFSPVTFPANAEATVTAVKSFDDHPRDVHAQRVGAHAKALGHELTGYFKDADRHSALDLKQLQGLRDLIGGILPAPDPVEDPAAYAEAEREHTFLQGVEFGIDLVRE